MTTYREHPLAHLTSVSPEGLRSRADIWREKGYPDPDSRLKNLLMDASHYIEHRRSALFRILKVFESDSGPELNIEAVAVQGLHAPKEARETLDTKEMWAFARILRAKCVPDDGGSTAAHLESAADELDHLETSLIEVIQACRDNEEGSKIRDLVMIGVRRLVREPTHEGSPLKM